MWLSWFSFLKNIVQSRLTIEFQKKASFYIFNEVIPMV